MAVQLAEPERLDLAIEGMTCSACSARLEQALVNSTGVLEATVNLASERAMIRIDPAQTDRDSVVDAVRRCGFDVGVQTDTSSDADGHTESERGQRIRERRAISLAAILTAPFIIQMAGMFANAPHLHLPPWVQLALVIPVQFALGSRFYRGAFNALRGGGANMDVLVAMGTTAAFAYSVYQMVVPGAGHLYFEASAVIITLVMVGKHIEARAKRGASAAIRALLALRPDTALVRLSAGELAERPVRDVQVGDTVVCRPGDRVAVDGIIARGEAEMDESPITGESDLVPKMTGDPVAAGSINIDGFIDIETRAVGENSTLAKMIRSVENAQASKPAVQRLVDRISAIFIPVVVSISAVTFAGWYLAGEHLQRAIVHLADLAGFAPPSFAGDIVEQALISAVAVLVIACPCALGLATPTAIMTGSGAAARAGILIKDIATLERAHDLSHVVFDKTGTLTEGKPAIAEIESLSDLEENEVLRVAATLQRGSEHPIAEAFRTAATNRGLALSTVEHFKSAVARGIEGDIDGVRYFIGNDRLFRDKGIDLPRRASSHRGTDVYLGARLDDGNALLARFEIVDAVRAEAKMAIRQLERLGVVPLLVSGDAAGATERIAKELGIGDRHAEAGPEDKAAIIRRLTAKGACVGMVGDGINDAPALAQAAVGIAMGSGTDVAMETAAMTLMRPDPRLVPAAIEASRKTFRKIKQNLFWAFLYNVIGLPLAALGFLSPSLAGAAMAFSSVSVVTNSLLLRSWQPKLDTPKIK